MYFCKKCKSEFKNPLIERGNGEWSIYSTVLLCPECGSDGIEYLPPVYCGFCGFQVSRGKSFCSETCKRMAEKYNRREKERKKKVEEFDVSKAIKEVDSYNKKHKTAYSYGQYFALKGLGDIIDEE